MEFSNEEITALIALVELHPILYDICCEDHRYKNKKTAAYQSVGFFAIFFLISMLKFICIDILYLIFISSLDC